jgi:hypothetical protein
VRRLFAPLLALSLLLVSCEFRSRRASWHPAAGVTYKLRYSAETRAKADGSWGAAPYVASAKAEFSVKAATDSAKGQIEIALAADTLDFKASERPPEEDAYMDGRLRKYRAKLTLSRTGQVVAFEEEPAQPPVDLTPLAIGRWLTYALPAFPDAALRQGARWDIVQPLLDKFHPDSRVAKHYTLSAIRQTPDGELATCLVEIEAFLAEDLGDTASAGPALPTLKGSGKVVFNLAKGIPESAELELTGRFQGGPPPAPGDTTKPAPARPLKLQQKLEIAFSD